MAEITHLPPTASSGDIIKVVERDGATIVDGFVSDEWLAAFNAEVQSNIDDYEPYDYGDPESLEFLGAQTVRFNGLMAKCPRYQELITDERLLGVMAHFLGPNCGQFQLNSSEVIEIHGGETAQELHIDDMIWPVNYWAPEKLLQFNVMVAGTDFTEENGATHVVPGSHRWSHTDRVPAEHEVARAVMKAGSAVFVPGKTIHGGGANTSGDPRRAIVASYVLGWLRSQENHYLHNKLEHLAKLTPKARELLGYDLYAHYDENLNAGPLGYYEYRSPAVLFD